MTDKRPLSPHLSVYRPQLTSVLSILHRATGIVLSLGVLLLVYWLSALASGEARFTQAQALIAHPLIQFVMLGALFAFFYHFCSGIRHLWWDMGKGLEIEQAYRSGWIVVIGSALLTAGSFVFAAMGRL